MNPSNEVLNEKIDNLLKMTERIEVHVKETNGQVAENSDHRIRQQTHNKWIKGILVLLVLPTGFLIIKSFF